MKAWRISLFFCFLQEGFVRAEWLEVGRSNRFRDHLLYNAAVVKLKIGEFILQVVIQFSQQRLYKHFFFFLGQIPK